MAKKVKAKAKVEAVVEVEAETDAVVEVEITEKPEITVKETSKPIQVDAAVLAGHISKAMKRYLKNKGK